MKASVFEAISESIRRGESSDLMFTVGDQEYIRKFLRNDRLIILGGGHVGLALCNMAAQLDFTITVVDDRPAFANSQRFAKAQHVICDSFESAIKAIQICRTDYVCVLTRGHRWDQHCVEAILSGEMPHYLGMIGSRRRVAGMKETLLEKGFDAERIILLWYV